MPDLIVTLVGSDHPGIVDSFARRIAENGGNWLESRMAHLAGKFAGILRVEVEAANVARLAGALSDLNRDGFKVVIEESAPETARARLRLLDLDVVGTDKPGIVRDISHVLASFGVNIEELTTDRAAAPMSGAPVFRARARVALPEQADTSALRRGIEAVASDLMVEAKLVEPEDAP
jgi:glycine cleavage system regulatory protein